MYGMGVVRGRSSVWLEHSTVTREVAGSNPVGPVARVCICWSCLAVRFERQTRCLYFQVEDEHFFVRPGGEIGRHAILRGWCRKA